MKTLKNITLTEIDKAQAYLRHLSNELLEVVSYKDYKYIEVIATQLEQTTARIQQLEKKINN